MILGGFNPCVITWRLSSAHELPLPTAVLPHEEGILRKEEKRVIPQMSVMHDNVMVSNMGQDGWCPTVFSVLFYFVNAKYLNHDYKSPFHDNGMYDHDILCAARGMPFFKDMLHNVRLGGMATTCWCV